jgi:transcriptional regulator with XRE-family HTH domain
MTPFERTMIVARRLREARELAGLGVGQAAKLSGVRAGFIRDREDGTYSTTVEAVAILAELYAVNFAWLVGEGPDMLDPTKLHAAAAYQLGKLSPADREKMLRSWAAIFGPAGPRFEPQIPQKESTS